METHKLEAIVRMEKMQLTSLPEGDYGYFSIFCSGRDPRVTGILDLVCTKEKRGEENFEIPQGAALVSWYTKEPISRNNQEPKHYKGNNHLLYIRFCEEGGWTLLEYQFTHSEGFYKYSGIRGPKE